MNNNSYVYQDGFQIGKMYVYIRSKDPIKIFFLCIDIAGDNVRFYSIPQEKYYVESSDLFRYYLQVDETNIASLDFIC